MAFGDVYEVVDQQTYHGQQCLNVYYYLNNNVLNGGASASDLNDSFLAEMYPLIRGAQTTAVNHTGLRTRNLFNPSDVDVRSHSLAGLRTNSNIEPPFIAVGYTLGSDNGALRKGAKRIAGLDDLDLNNGAITVGAALTALTALGGGMENTLAIWLAEVFMPVIVGRILDGGSYRLPASASEATLGAVVDVIYSLFPTTQNSRKLGRGA